MPVRGTYQFEIQDGKLVNSVENLERMRNLFQDGSIIKEHWGPGRTGDFDYGSWHCLCHLVAGSGVYKVGTGYLWVAITHAKNVDKYLATVSYRDSNRIVKTYELISSEGRNILNQANLVGYIEGTSCGHISARNVQDLGDAFNGWKRQDYDKPVASDDIGGTVWEHYCTTRDLRPSNKVGDSVLRSYLTLVSTLGGKFVVAVLRGRRAHEHPLQLCALVKAGFILREEALWAIRPNEISKEAEDLLREARPDEALKAVAMLPWAPSEEQRYYMYKRRIRSWSTKSDVESDLRSFGL